MSTSIGIVFFLCANAEIASAIVQRVVVDVIHDRIRMLAGR